MRKLRKASLVIGIMAAILRSAASKAEDYQPFDWVPLPAGTNLVSGYFEYGDNGQFNNTITGTSKIHTNLGTYAEIGRYLHFFDLLGHRVDVQAILPFAQSTNGKINGQSLGGFSGLVDPQISIGGWFINSPDEQRYLSLATFLSLPVGTYDRNKTLNAGDNRWHNDLQADFMQGSNKFWIDVNGDWTVYGNNDQAGTGNQRLRQRATYQAFAWLSYDVSDLVQRVMPQASNATLSVGFAQYFGGAQTLDGTRTGAKTSEQQIRATYIMFFSPKWQGLLSVSHDVAANGQFKQDFGLTLRVARPF